MIARAGSWLFQFGLFLCVWWLFVDNFAWSETAVGAGAAALAATASEAVKGVEHPRFFPHLRWMLEFWRVPGQILYDCGLLVRHLFRMLFAGRTRTGRFLTAPFRARGNDARAVARRSLAILYTTLPPNSIVIGIDRARSSMLLHLLESAQVPPIVGILERKT